MSAPAFTPGPWNVSGQSGCKTIRGDKSARHRQAQYRDIASTVGLSDEEEDTANARLIAAAPDLYGALNRIADDPPACASNLKKPAGQPDCDCWSCILVREARAALEKAVAP